MTEVFSFEVRRLMQRFAALGEPRELAESLRAANPLGLDTSALSSLREILRKERARELDAEDPYIPVWAWRALAILGNDQDLGVLVELLLWAAPDDEWAFRELPPLLARRGQATLPLLLNAIAQDFILAQEARALDAVLEAVEGVHAGDVLARDTIRTALREKLSSYRLNPPALNACLIRSLSYMADAASLPLIKEAYASAFVDEKVFSGLQCQESLQQVGVNVESLPTARPLAVVETTYVGERNFARLLCASGVGGSYHEHQALVVGALQGAGPVDVAALLRELRTDPGTRNTQDFGSIGQADFFTRQFQAYWQEMALAWRGRALPMPARLPARDPLLARALCDDDPLNAAALREAAENQRACLLAYRDGFEFAARRVPLAARRLMDLVEQAARQLEELCTRDEAWLAQNMARLNTVMKEIADLWLRAASDYLGQARNSPQQNVN